MSRSAPKKDEPKEDEPTSVRDVEPVASRVLATVLQQIEGHGAPRDFILDRDEIVVGRSNQANISVDSNMMSRRHFELRRKGPEFVCTDLDSANGLFINAVKASSAVLCDGDTVQAGDVVFVYRRGGARVAGRPSQEFTPPPPELPFPLAILRGLADSHISRIARLKALLDALENGLRFLVACELAAVRDGGAPEAVAELACVLPRSVQLDRPLSMGAWLVLAFEIARIMEEDVDLVCRAAARSLVSRKRGESQLTKDLRAAVSCRNELAHTATRAEDAYRDQELATERTFGAFLQAMEPLAQRKLVSVAEMDLGDDEEDFSYKLYAHQGASEIFRLEDVVHRSKMRKDWCYLLRGNDNPLLLAPLVAAAVPEGSSRLEVVMAPQLVLGPKAIEVELRGTVSGLPVELEIPWNARIRDLHEKVAVV